MFQDSFFVNLYGSDQTIIFINRKKKFFWNERSAFKKRIFIKHCKNHLRIKNLFCKSFKLRDLVSKILYLRLFGFKNFFFETFWIQKYLYLRRFILDILDIFILVKHSFCLKNKCFFAFIFIKKIFETNPRNFETLFQKFFFETLT